MPTAPARNTTLWFFANLAISAETRAHTVDDIVGVMRQAGFTQIEARPHIPSITSHQWREMRAGLPDQSGYLDRGGVKLYWELFGSGDQTVFFLPTWSIVHSRHRKAPIPYFAPDFRVLTFDGRGSLDQVRNGFDDIETP